MQISSQTPASSTPITPPTIPPTPKFGRTLDSGTGVHSMKWLVRLEESGCLTGWDGVTADESMRRTVQRQLEDIKVDSKGEIIIGNWASDEEGGTGDKVTGFKVRNGNHGYLVKDRLYDTILCDYLIGAVDGFSPYYQDLIIPRVKRHLRPGGRIYVVGLNPVPDKVEGKGNVVCEVRRARDAAILLAGEFEWRGGPRGEGRAYGP